MLLKNALDYVGNTPMVQIEIDNCPNIRVSAKLEGYNPTGSIKDRAANFVLSHELKSGKINKRTTILESSSGNFGVALAAYCRRFGLDFICVVDPCILPINESLIKAFGGKVIKVQDEDENGGYLLSRIAKVKELESILANCYWTNQYSNPLIAEAYFKSVGEEICRSQDVPVDYVFVGTSSGGSITGISKRVKLDYPHAKIIAVDMWGSVIFGTPPSKRFIPGIGSSMVPNILNHAVIDDVVMVDEEETIRQCKHLLQEKNIFVGGSSGSVMSAIVKYFTNNPVNKSTNVVAVFPDRGERYISTIYNESWCLEQMAKKYMPGNKEFNAEMITEKIIS